MSLASVSIPRGADLSDYLRQSNDQCERRIKECVERRRIDALRARIDAARLPQYHQDVSPDEGNRCAD